MLSSKAKAAVERRSIAGFADAVRERRPLVHCITNYVTVNDCANALLAVGASPVMADDEAEVADITAIANALVVNIGTLNARTVSSMEVAAREAVKRGIPIVLDPVGAGASRMRTDAALSLIGTIPFAVIRGNASEIRVLATGAGSTRGVDASDADAGAVEIALRDATELARRTGAVVAVTGATDVVTDGKISYAIANGHRLMGDVTGSGCMLSAIIGAFAATARDGTTLADSVTCALCAMGIAGEKAAKIGARKGTGSMRTALIDGLSRLDAKAIARGMRLDAL